MKTIPSTLRRLLVPATAALCGCASLNTHGRALAAALDPYTDSLERSGRSGAVLVARSGDVVYARGFGYADREHAIRNTPETLFDIASVAKVFTAVAIARLETDGLLRSSDSIARFFPFAPPEKRGVTIRNLLTHTAGMQSFHDTTGDFEQMDRTEALKRIMADSLLFPAGTKERYSNSAYTLLAMVVEQVSRTTWEEYLRRRVFAPAGLRNATFWGDSSAALGSVAKGYVGSALKGDPSRWPLTWASRGAAGLMMSARDLFEFTRALELGKIVPRAVDQRMQIPELRKWASGWEVSSTPYGRLVMKGGSSEFGTTAQLRRYVDRDVTIVVLLNSTKGSGDYPHQEITPILSDLVFAALKQSK